MTLRDQHSQDPADARIIAGRFALGKKLGEGAFGAVYEARDQELEQRVAVKSLRDVDARALHRFKREFRALRGMSHPNLVTLHELISEGDAWFLVMEFVPGRDMVSWVRGDNLTASSLTATQAPAASFTSGPPFDPSLATDQTLEAYGAPTLDAAWESPADARQTKGPSGSELTRIRAALNQLLDGLEALHAGGIVHRDLKPGNVLVTPDGELRVLDFGLVTALASEDAAKSRGLAGTPYYMAPEQASGEGVTAASDLYAVGVILFELLTGTVPFDGTISQILVQKATREAPSPASVIEGLPRELCELTEALLRRAPEERPTLQQVRERLLALEDSEDSPPTPRPQSVEAPRLSERDVFLGREQELQALEEAWRDLAQGGTTVAQIGGLSGMGKSTLAEHFVNACRRREPNVLVLQGACFEGELIPYKGLDSAIDHLVEQLRNWPAPEVTGALPVDIRELSQVFPVLKQLDAVREALKGDLGHEVDAEDTRSRAFSALRELLTRLGSRKRLVLHVEDLQWLDRDGVLLFMELLREPRPPRMLLVLTFRSDEVEESPNLARLLEWIDEQEHLSAHAVELTRWPEEVGQQVAEAYLRQHPDWQRRDADAITKRALQISRAAEGSAFFIQELAQSHDQDIPDLTDALARRIERLSATERLTLDLLAVADHPVHRATVALAVERDDIARALESLRVARLLRVHADEQSLSLYHGRIRDALLFLLEDAERSARFQRLIEASDARDDTDDEHLLSYLIGANQLARAVPLALDLAEQAKHVGAFDRAVELHRFALEHASSADIEPRAQQQRLADALSQAGACGEAGSLYLSLAEGAASDAERNELRIQAAEQLSRTPRYREAEGLADALCEDYQIPVPAQGRWGMFVFLWLLFRIWWRGDRWQVAPERVSEREIERSRFMTILSTVIVPQDYQRGPQLLARAHLLALRCGDLESLLQTTHMLRGILCATPFQRLRARLDDLYERELRPTAEQDPEQMQDALIQGNFHRDVSYHMLALELERCREGLQHHLRHRGRLSAANRSTAMWIRTCCEVFRGDFKELAEWLPPEIIRGQEVHDVFRSANLKSAGLVDLELAQGRPESARTSLREAIEARGDDVLLLYRAHEIIFGTRILLYEGCVREAWELAFSRADEFERSGLLRSIIVGTNIFWARGIALSMAIHQPTPGLPSRETLLKSMRRNTRRMRRIGAPTANSLALGWAAAEKVRRGQALAQAAQQLDEASVGLRERGGVIFAWGTAYMAAQLREDDAAMEQILEEMRAKGVEAPRRYLNTTFPPLPD